MGKKVIFNLFAIVFLLSACVSRNVIDKKLYENDDFNSELSLKYKQYALVSRQNGVKKDYRYFDKKSRKIERLSDDEILTVGGSRETLFSEKEKFEIYNYKNRLLDLVNGHNIKANQPIKAANLFFFLDCWNYYSFVTNNYTQAAYCRKNFVDSFLATEREYKHENNVFYKDNNYRIQLTEEEKKFFDRFNNGNVTSIYFDYDNYKPNKESLIEIKNFLKYISNLNEDYMVTIVGHADRIGNVMYNNTLSRKRAKSVYNILVKNGVPAEFIKINSRGSKEPAVITDSKNKNKLNRRVELILEKNYNVKQDYLPQPL